MERRYLDASSFKIDETFYALSERTGRAIEGFPIVLAIDKYRPAHFMQAGAKAGSYSILQRFFAVISTFVEIIGGKYRDLSVVVTGIDDVIHGVLNPLRRF